LRRQVARAKDPDLTAAVPSSELPLGISPTYLLDLRAYNQAETAAVLRQPILVLQGGRDYQVTAEDFEGWRAKLAGRDDATLKLYPKLNHLFEEGEGKATPAEYMRPGHVAEYVVSDIAEWIKAIHSRR
jgi:fermentation-respiration switch protein FrsA (DUF1100 family)